MLKVTISGMTGFVGRNVGRSLVKDGFEVLGISRRRREAGFCKIMLSKDFAGKKTISAVRGSDAFLHLIGKGRQTVDSDYEEVNVDLTRKAVGLCKEAGIRKIVYLSGLGLGRDSTLGYFISKFKAEREIIRSGLDYTIFRPSYIIGNGDHLSRVLERQSRSGTVIIPGSGRYRIQPIFIGDVVKIITEAIRNKGFSKKIVDLVGPRTVRYDDFVAEMLGKRKIVIKKTDFEQAYHDALHNKSEFGVDDLSLLVGDYLGDHKRLEKISGIKLTRYESMLEACRLS